MIKPLFKLIVPSTTWETMSRFRWRMERKWYNYQNLGIGSTVSIALSELITPWRSENHHSIRRLRLPKFNYPFYYRECTSDADVIRQVFGNLEYECAAGERGISLILDCGANIGCTSFFFLHRYPDAHVVAIEPDPGNFAMCRRNLAPFGDRVALLNVGVWPTRTSLKVERGGFGDGREWSFFVRPVKEDEQADFLSVTVGDLIRESGHQMIDLLKIDIEGGEQFLFQEGTVEWLNQTRNLVIELHGPECERIFYKALNHYQYEKRHRGELTYCRGLVKQ